MASPTSKTVAGAVLLTGILSLGACGGVAFRGGGALASEMSPQQRKVCQQAVQEELDRRNIPAEAVRDIYYQPRYGQQHFGRDRIIGFDAWVDPKEGKGHLVIKLSEACRILRVWVDGPFLQKE